MANFISKIINRSEYVKNTFTLAGGTALSLLVLILISPILSRLYTEDNFGVLTLYMSITSVLTTIVTGRYEFAIMLPKSEKEAVNLTMISIILSFIISFIIFIIMIVFNEVFVDVLDTPEMSVWLLIIPLNVLLISVYQSLYYWSNRKTYYKSMAISRITKNTSFAAINVGGGFLKLGNIGLIAGRLFGDFVAAITLLFKVFKNDKEKIKQVSVKDMGSVARKYKQFPTFLVFSHSLGTLNGELPTFMIKFFYSLGMLGQYSWAYRIIEMPTSIISRNMGDVFRQRATDDYHENGKFNDIFVKTVRNLFLIAIVPFIIFWFIAPELFAFVLGSEWRIAGDFAKILSISTLFSFIVGPIDKASLIVGNTQYSLFWHGLRFILNIGSFLLVKSLSLPIESYFYVLVSINVFMYLIELSACYRFSLGYKKILNNDR